SAPTPILDYRPDLPKRLAAVVETMMEKDPAARYQTPAELYDALASWDEGTEMPPDHEMPQLSPAAMGGHSTNRLPAVTKPSPSAHAVRPRRRRWRFEWLKNPRARTAVMVAGLALAGLAGAAAAVLAAH